MIRKTKTKAGKVRYSPRVHLGGGRYKLLGTYPTKAKAEQVKAEWILRQKGAETRSVGEYVDFWLDGYRERVKVSSYDTARAALRVFRREFETRSLASITPMEAEAWARKNRWATPPVVTMLNGAVEKGLIERNPFAGLGKKGPGRKNITPLSVADVDRLAKIATKLHGQFLGSFVLFTAYTGMRVGEVFALEWADIDFDENRVMVKRRVYRGELDLPKSNRERRIVLPPPARDALLALDRSTATVFRGKRGGRLSQSGLAYYWQGVTAAFGRKVTPHEFKHFAGHFLYVTMGLPDRVVAVQLGHTDGGKLVRELYGHGDVGALEEIDRAFESNVVPLRKREAG